MTDSEKMDLILEKISTLDNRMDSFDKRMDSFDKRMDSFDRRMDSFETSLQEVNQHTRNTDLILENEIRVNIKRVAEGHLDLSRILHDAMHPSSELEMLSLRVSVLESDMKKLKAKVS